MSMEEAGKGRGLSGERDGRLSGGDFLRLGRFIYDSCGIRMPPSKKTMLESRLQKRLRALGMNSFAEYCRYLFSEDGGKDEVTRMIDVITTNKTEFFRESDHFFFLAEKILPEWAGTGQVAERIFRAWSAGCSTGEEPYTLAMFLQEFTERVPEFDYSIMATDISTRVLETARLAVYPEERIASIPVGMKRKYILKGREHNRGLVRVAPELRRKITFRWLNFMSDDFRMQDQYDVIFCRNVIIYFDRPTQQNLLRRFQEHLRPGGHLILGHSETLAGYNLPLKPVHPTIYRNCML